MAHAIFHVPTVKLRSLVLQSVSNVPAIGTLLIHFQPAEYCITILTLEISEMVTFAPLRYNERAGRKKGLVAKFPRSVVHYDNVPTGERRYGSRKIVVNNVVLPDEKLE